MVRMILLASCLLVGASQAMAQGGGTGDADRYVITPVEGGILRVDRQTGEVSLCKSEGGQWGCQIVDEGSAPRFAAPQSDSFDNAQDLTKEDIDQAVDSFEYMVERLLGAAQRMRNNPDLQALPPPQ